MRLAAGLRPDPQSAGKLPVLRRFLISEQTRREGTRREGLSDEGRAGGERN